MFSRKQLRVAHSIAGEPFFRTMPTDLVEKIQALVYHREYDARQVIFFPEDACDFVYWIRTGRVKVMRVSSDGRELTFRHEVAGGMIGAESLSGRARWLDYGEALEPSILCLMRMTDFARLIMEEKDFASAVAIHLGKRVTELEEGLAQFVFLNVRSRIAAGLLRLYAKKHDPKGAIRITHQELSNLVGAARETTTSILHEFQDRKMVELANRCIVVLDSDALHQVVLNG